MIDKMSLRDLPLDRQLVLKSRQQLALARTGPTLHRHIQAIHRFAYSILLEHPPIRTHGDRRGVSRSSHFNESGSSKNITANSAPARPRKIGGWTPMDAAQFCLALMVERTSGDSTESVRHSVGKRGGHVRIHLALHVRSVGVLTCIQLHCRVSRLGWNTAKLLNGRCLRRMDHSMLA